VGFKVLEADTNYKFPYFRDTTLDRLSRRELQVADLVYKGETNKSIGIQLGISIKTVEKYRGKAMKKWP